MHRNAGGRNARPPPQRLLEKNKITLVSCDGNETESLQDLSGPESNTVKSVSLSLSSVAVVGNCLSKSKGVCCWDCGRQATMRGARQPHVAASRPIQMQFISPHSNSRVNFTCAKMCLPSDRFLVKSPEKWHKDVTSCHENAAGQPLCRLRRRQQPHSCKFLYLHILWQCGHQQVHST